MKNRHFPGYLIIFLVACHSNHHLSSTSKFVLNGTTHGFSDGTKIYCTDILSNQIFDSVTVVQNKFRLEKDLAVSPVHIFLHTKDYSEARSVWVENGTMTFDGSDSSFENATITGSVTEKELNNFLAQLDTISSEDEATAFTKDFIRTHPDNRASAAMLAGYAPDWGKTLVKELFSGLSPENQNSVYGQQIARFIALNKQHETGDQFTDFEMVTADGTPMKLSEHLGRVTLLEFWASWCGPCRKQSPELVKIYRQYKDAGFRIVSVSLDFSKDGWIKAIQQDSLDWNHVSDLQGRNCTACMIYGINTIPDNYLIDANGKIIAKYVWGEQLEEAIENALQLK